MQFDWLNFWDYIGTMLRCSTRISLNGKPVDDYGGHYTSLRGAIGLVSSDGRFSSMANGCPAAIHDHDSDTALPSESLLSPGDYTPMGYLASSVALAQISGHIFQGMYSVPPQRVPNVQGNRLSRRTIADLYGELVRWRHDVHPHLRINPNAQDNS